MRGVIHVHVHVIMFMEFGVLGSISPFILLNSSDNPTSNYEK